MRDGLTDGMHHVFSKDPVYGVMIKSRDAIDAVVIIVLTIAKFAKYRST